VSRLYALSQGDPLVLRYYVEYIWQAGGKTARLTIEELEAMRPGFGNFFRRSLKAQRVLWKQSGRSLVIEQDQVDAILSILACAHGVLRDANLMALLAEMGVVLRGGRLSDHLEPISRFIIGSDRATRESAGYILGHPRLGLYLRDEYFDVNYIQRAKDAFAQCGKK